MVTRIVWSLVVVGALAGLGRTDDKQKAGTTSWEKDYPKVSAAGADGLGRVELKGEYKPGDGWTVKESWYDYVPKGGGVVVERTKLAFADSVWGEKDAKGKIVAAEAKIAKGEWNMRVMFVFEKKLPDGTTTTVNWQTAWKQIEVK